MADQLVETRTEQPSPAPAARRFGAGTVFGSAFLVLLVLLLVRNTGVFTLHVAERGDSAANSIIIEQAKHFRLLVGNYSRVNFNHPGPAFFYIMALGEWLGYDLLHAVPSPYNGQWLAIIVLNSALVAAALTVIRSWVRSWRTLGWCAAMILAFIALHDGLLSSTWPPFLYVAPFLLFLTSAASVAAGRTAHLWLLTLSGGLLVHGHAEFLLLFVPAIALVTFAALWYPRWRAPQPGGARLWHWGAAGLVVAVFGLPMVLNLILHWPGEFKKYLTYGRSLAAHHGILADLKYLLWFWIPQRPLAVLVVPVLFAAGIVLARRQPDGQLRRFLTAAVGMVALATLLFAGYILHGVDQLDSYIGYFFWSAPLVLLLVLTVGLVGLLGGEGEGERRLGRLLPVAALAGALVFAAVSPAMRTMPEQARDVPPLIRTLSGYAAGREVVLSFDHDSWPTMTAVIIAAERARQPICVADRSWHTMVTYQFICDPKQIANGAPVQLTTSADHASVMVSFGGRTVSMPAYPT